MEPITVQVVACANTGADVPPVCVRPRIRYGHPAFGGATLQPFMVAVGGVQFPVGLDREAGMLGNVNERGDGGFFDAQKLCQFSSSWAADRADGLLDEP